MRTSTTGEDDGRFDGRSTAKPRIEVADLAWAAGFFDGEGSTLLKGGYPGISIHQAGTLTDPPEVLVRFQRTFGGIGYVAGPDAPTNEHHRPRWTYETHGYERTQVLVAMMWKWLGPIKRSQAVAVLTAFRDRPVPKRRAGVTRGRPLNTACKRGHSYNDAYVDPLGRRYCRPCRDEHHRRVYQRRKEARAAVKAATSAGTSRSRDDPIEGQGQGS